MKQVSFRNIKSIDYDTRRANIKRCGLLEVSCTSTTNWVDLYESTLAALIDTHAPINTKIKTLCPVAPWYTPEIHKQKIIKRCLECRWRTTRLTVDREQYTHHCASVNRLISNAKTKYYKDMISDCGSDQRELFRKTERIFKGNKHTAERNYLPCATSEQLANNFADFFENKVEAIRNNLSTKCANQTCPHTPETIPLLKEVKLESFAPISTKDLVVLTRKMAKKSCVLDPIPAKVFMECSMDLLPVMTNIVNDSLDTAFVHNNLKSAALEP